MYYYLYKITNILNNKIYFGVHETSNLEDNYFGSGTYLKNSINKYGINNFKKEILEFFESRELMYCKEKSIVTPEFIKLNNTYNLNEGGNGGFYYINSSGKAHKFNSSINKKCGLNSSLKLKEKCKDANFKNSWKNNISSSVKKYYSENKHPWLNRHHSEETKLKLSEKAKITSKGSNNSQFGKIWIYNETLQENKKILKTDIIPIGWNYGRRLKWK